MFERQPATLIKLAGQGSTSRGLVQGSRFFAGFHYYLVLLMYFACHSELSSALPLSTTSSQIQALETRCASKYARCITSIVFQQAAVHAPLGPGLYLEALHVGHSMADWRCTCVQATDRRIALC